MRNEEKKPSRRFRATPQTSQNNSLLLTFLFLIGGAFSLNENIRRIRGLLLYLLYFSLLLMPGIDLMAPIEFRGLEQRTGALYRVNYENSGSQKGYNNGWYECRYFFEYTDGVEYLGKSFLAKRCEEGSEVKIEFPAGRPERSRLQGGNTSSHFIQKNSEWPPFGVFVVGGFYIFFGLIIYYALYNSFKGDLNQGRTLSSARHTQNSVETLASIIIALSVNGAKLLLITAVPTFITLLILAKLNAPLSLLNPILQPIESGLFRLIGNRPLTYDSLQLQRYLSDSRPAPLEIYRVRGGKSERLADESRVSSGDVLQPIYNLEEHRNVMLFVKDGSGAVTRLFPNESSRVASRIKKGRRNFPFSYRLTNISEYELFVMLTSKNRFPSVAGELIIENHLNRLLDEKTKPAVYLSEDIEIFTLRFRAGTDY